MVCCSSSLVHLASVATASKPLPPCRAVDKASAPEVKQLSAQWTCMGITPACLVAVCAESSKWCGMWDIGLCCFKRCQALRGTVELADSVKGLNTRLLLFVRW